MIKMNNKQEKVMCEFYDDLFESTKTYINKYHLLNLLRLQEKPSPILSKEDTESLYWKHIKMKDFAFNQSVLGNYKAILYYLADCESIRAKLSGLSQVNCFTILLIFSETELLNDLQNLNVLYVKK